MLDLWDWRFRVSTLYSRVRAISAPETAWALWRETRDDLFANHPQSALDKTQLAGFKGLTYFPYDPAARLTVWFRPVEPERHDMSVGEDGQVRMIRCARTEGIAERYGAELDVFWIEGYGGGIFLPFRDASAGDRTYGGGRYLLDTIKGADLGISQNAEGWSAQLDFNFAYNPSCAYSPRWVCPLAPAGNRLPLPVLAGECAPDAGTGDVASP